MAIVLGLDPGTLKAGYGLLKIDGDRLEHLAHGTIKLKPQSHISLRLSALYTELRFLFDRYAIDDVAVESIFLGKNAASVFKLGQARGVCLLAAGQAEAELYEYSPKRVKLMVAGSGSASKDQVKLLGLRHLGIESDEGEDATDALALALCHVFENKFKFSNFKPDRGLQL